MAGLVRRRLEKRDGGQVAGVGRLPEILQIVPMVGPVAAADQAKRDGRAREEASVI